MRLTRIGTSFAQCVEDTALWSAMPANDVAALADAWRDSGVLVFRRQSLSERELVAFSSRFGEPDRIVRQDWAAQDAPEVTLISNMRNGEGQPIGGLGAGELGWHTDQSYVLNPATGSILYMVEMPPDGGRTYWANLRLAYDALPADMKRRIAGLHGIYDYVARQRTYDDEPPMSDALRRKTPLVTHPLVMRDPTTGAPSLYLDPTTMTGVVGMSMADGTALLDELCAHASQPAYVYAHEWQVGDVVMWDNGFLMHRRDAYKPDALRLLKRTTLRLSADRHVVPDTALYDPGNMETDDG